VCGRAKGAQSVGSIESRSRRFEERRGVCHECGLAPDGPRRIAVINEEHPERSFTGDSDERCGRCGRPLYTVLRVYEEEGGRLYLDEYVHGNQAQRRALHAAR
jgi:hypothetical protein